ncbi:hypothetical protein P4N68_10580 [Corynebacterium felinum]|uniref:DNA-binding transcriptional regulator AlpA n=1 Tax=Corynebacterium felinum TaxID=131318 RepID=A0ABU2B610_9CORY|nr:MULTISPECIES: hypothetical protein [Corynebacterium]MDF5821518.1 hypothetical protein [Corynebacterium felinum]MDO4761152.1 hypothetical protein [Corynebacterium sp.]MDR7354040.1 putative DNA-binding transcriptional regulator AlpA [Corynebacterium felinum]WJY96214.1 hypothetical protein CFELI_13175 [Corynebacterium felinum]
MKPMIIDADTQRVLWRVDDCAAHCGIVSRTWTSYCSEGRTPKAVAMLGKGSPLWDAEEVKHWHANRSGSPVKNHPTSTVRKRQK